MSDQNGHPPQTDVYAIHGAEPEVLAYAMAKYSRSALTLKASLAEISTQRAEQFLNTFYFQYGHRSIADLAHIPFAIERLSLLAAIELVDEQRWDGQERSTRYQNFRLSGWFTPPLAAETPTFTAAVERLFTTYDKVSAGMLTALKAAIPQPESMKSDAYERTLKARAFDVARYLLPLATNTSLGQIVNARTLETQVSRLLSHPAAEIRDLGAKLREAATGPAWNLAAEANANLQAQIAALAPELALESEPLLIREVRTAPTLVKYAQPDLYAPRTGGDLSKASAELFANIPIAPAPLVDLVERTETLEVELAATLLYSVSHHPYRQIRDVVVSLPEARTAEIIEIGLQHRGRHDELLRSFSSGHSLRFDILMDIGGFRDMHRHRRCVQLLQAYTDLHGYDEPVCPGQPTLAEAGLEATYTASLDSTYATYRQLHDSGVPEAAQSAQYCLPLATRCRSLFKMDFAEALYISELRSGVAGHFSYRRVAWEMYREVARKHPSLAQYFRIEDVNQPVDLLRR